MIPFRGSGLVQVVFILTVCGASLTFRTLVGTKDSSISSGFHKFIQHVLLSFVCGFFVAVFPFMLFSLCAKSSNVHVEKAFNCFTIYCVRDDSHMPFLRVPLG